MKSFALALSVALGLSACSVVASATTTTLYSSDTSGAAAAGSIGVSYLGYQGGGSFVAATSSTTYGLPLVSPWVGIAGENAASHQGWVSYNSGTYVGGPTTAPAGNYFYGASFSSHVGDTVTLTVLADDTATVSVNAFNSVITPTSYTPAANCVAGSPTCITTSTYNISSYIMNGTNSLTFAVDQLYGSATGLNFSITDTTAATPEPSSLMLLGTGVLGAAGMVRRRFVA